MRVEELASPKTISHDSDAEEERTQRHEPRARTSAPDGRRDNDVDDNLDKTLDEDLDDYNESSPHGNREKPVREISQALLQGTCEGFDDSSTSSVSSRPDDVVILGERRIPEEEFGNEDDLESQGADHDEEENGFENPADYGLEEDSEAEEGVRAGRFSEMEEIGIAGLSNGRLQTSPRK